LKVPRPTLPSIDDLKKGIKELRWNLDLFIFIQLFVVLIVFIMFLIVPLFRITYNAFIYSGSLSLRWFSEVLSDPYYFSPRIVFTDQFPYIAVTGISGSLFSVIKRPTDRGIETIILLVGYDMGVIPNTIMVAILTTVFSTIIGFIFAFIFARYKFPGSEVLRIALLAPLLSTPFIGAIGLKKMLTSEGVVNTLFYDILHIMPFKIEPSGLMAVVLVQTLIFYPIIFLNAYTAIIGIDPTMEEQAENLGASGFRLFRTVTLPLSLPGVEAGALLVFILSLEDLGTPIVFIGTNAEKVLTYQIFRRMFTPAGYISGEATALAMILLAMSIIIFISIRKYVSLRRYAMLTKGGIWRPRRRELSLKTTLLVYVISIFMLFMALQPHLGVILLAFAGEWGPTLLPGYFTSNNFISLFSDAAVFRSITNSLSYSTVAMMLIVVLGVSAAYLVSRIKIPGMEALDALVTLPIAIPGIVIATGFFLLFLKTPLDPIASGAPLLIISYTIRKFPFTVRAVFAGFEQVDKALEESAINLGANRARVFFTIALPLVVLNILAGGMLSFIYSMSEVSTGIVIGDANPETAPMTWKMYDILFKGLQGGLFVPAAMGFILMTLQFIMIVGSNLLLRKRATALIGV
jgi:ABC-type Fe3+ transport system permease subunit